MCVSASSRESQRPAVRVYVALGANLGDVVATLRDAVRWLAELPGTTVHAASSLYRTAPWEAQGPDFFNAVVALDTQLTAPDVLMCLHALEARAGRERPHVNAPRTLDLDLLLYGHARIDSPRLTVPHPRMWQRAFVMVPLADVAPQWVPAEALHAVAGQGVERVGALTLN